MFITLLQHLQILERAYIFMILTIRIIIGINQFMEIFRIPLIRLMQTLILLAQHLLIFKFQQLQAILTKLDHGGPRITIIGIFMDQTI